MARIIALLRGVNVSGRNKIAMAELKEGLEALGYTDVKTCLNSGNAVFTATEADGAAERIRDMISERFDADIPVFVIEGDGLRQLLTHAPEWWGSEDKAVYDNLIFVLPPDTAEKALQALGAPKAELEQIEECMGAIFWSFSRKDYQKTNWWHRTAEKGIGEMLTIRTAGTMRKLEKLL